MSNEQIVDVWDEPFHHGIFQNDAVQIFRVLVPSGGMSLFHRHVANGIVFWLADGSIENQEIGKDWISRSGVRGQVGTNGPRIHRIRNVGEQNLQLVDIEIRASPLPHATPPLSDPKLQAQREHSNARAYSLTLDPGETTNPLTTSSACILVAVTDGVIEMSAATGTRILAWTSGTALWETSMAQTRIRNVGESPLQLGLVELK